MAGIDRDRRNRRNIGGQVHRRATGDLVQAVRDVQRHVVGIFRTYGLELLAAMGGQRLANAYRVTDLDAVGLGAFLTAHDGPKEFQGLGIGQGPDGASLGKLGELAEAFGI